MDHCVLLIQPSYPLIHIIFLRFCLVAIRFKFVLDRVRLPVSQNIDDLNLDGSTFVDDVGEFEIRVRHVSFPFRLFICDAVLRSNFYFKIPPS